MSIINKKMTILGASMGLVSILMMPASPSVAASVEQRLQRLESIADSAIFLQLSTRLSEQQREIQALQDMIDHLNYNAKNIKKLSNKRLKETDDRLNSLEIKESAEPHN